VCKVVVASRHGRGCALTNVHWRQAYVGDGNQASSGRSGDARNVSREGGRGSGRAPADDWVRAEDGTCVSEKPRRGVVWLGLFGGRLGGRTHSCVTNV